jgi:hypothetical protein
MSKHKQYDDDDDHHDFRDDDRGDHDNDLPPIKINASLDPTAEKTNGDAITGSGIPGHGWLVQDNGHIEVAQLNAYRTGHTIQPYAVDHDGTFIFNDPAGPQVIDPAHDVSVANANRAALSESWSFDTGANGPGGQTQQQFLASGGHEQIKIDLDPGAGFKWLTLDAKYDPLHATGSSSVVWVAHDNTFVPKGTVVVNDDAGNAYTTQNSTNLAFFKQFIDTDPHTPGVQQGPIGSPGTYDFETLTTDAHNHVLADIHSSFHLA